MIAPASPIIDDRLLRALRANEVRPLPDIAFLLTNRYQVHHYAPLAAALPWPSRVIVELRDRSFGVDTEFVRQWMGDVDVRFVEKRDLRDLDGTADVIICQTPVLPQVGMAQTLVVAQQYSLAKERYQYGVWRSLADLNVMYGPHSVSSVDGFCHAVAIGNPLFDGRPWPPSPTVDESAPVLYLPTYGSLGSLRHVADHLDRSDVDVVVRFHHMAGEAERASVPRRWRVDDTDVSPVDLIESSRAVITDFSGAAFDAARARRPLLLVQQLDGAATDHHRLSQADRQHTALADLANRFDAGADLVHQLQRATELAADDDAFHRFVDRHYVEHGTAAHAFAREVLGLVENGPQRRFAWDQVRDRNRELMDRNRALNDEVRRLRRANSRLRSAPSRKVAAVGERAARRVRVAAARHPAVERRLVEARRRLRGDRPAPRSALTPGVVLTVWEQRERIATELRRGASEVGLVMAECSVDHRPEFAIEARHRDELARAMRIVSEGGPELVVTERGRPIRLSEVSSADIALAQHVEIHAAAAHEGEGVRICIAGRDADGRLRSLDTRMPVVDWTDDFERRSGSPRAVSTMFDGPIDAVYTWVDSSDPAWIRRRALHRPDDQLTSSANPERYLDRHELRFSLRSLWACAPFIRRVFLVTDQQVPSWLSTADDRLVVVDHTDIFPDLSVLPTFNSHAIEACLHRIPGLADRFVYFNDDFFLGREVTPDDLFTRAGLPRVRFAPSQPVPRAEPEPTAIPTDWAAFNARSLVEQEFGIGFDRKHQHVPYALDRRLLEEFDDRFRDRFDETRRARFRSRTDLAIPSMFAHFAGVAAGRAVEWRTAPEEYVYADTGRADAELRFGTISATRPKFFCLNSTLHSSVPLDVQAERMADLLTSMYPSPSPFERS